jgi:hypothetical protein
MKPSKTVEQVARFLISLSLFFACPLFLSAQTDNKKTTAPPPPAKASTPAATQKSTTAPKATDPNRKPTDPNRKPLDPSRKPLDPSRKPLDPSRKPLDPSRKPLDPSRYLGRPGDQAKDLPGGRKEFFNATTRQRVTTNAEGVVTQIKAPHGLSGAETVINRGPRGGMIAETGHPGSRVVSYGPGRGFVERPLRPGYISRTYVRDGRSYARVYREYSYHGVVYYHYVPAFYYGPRFYYWAVTPWGPVRYAWGGIVAPWVGFYAGYFTPYPMYASPDLWLTDYLLAENLRLAYESQQAENGGQAPAPEANAQPAATGLSDDVKAQIAEEVKQQLAAERAAAAQPASSASQEPASGGEQLPPAMSQKFFVASSNLELTTAEGHACSLTPGDTLERTSKKVAADGGVAAEVISSKPGDCAAESMTTVQLADLEEMHNQFRERLDSGLSMLAKNEAKGLPDGPAAGARPVAEGTAEPAPDAEATLVAQDTEATNLEAKIRQN